MYSEHQWLRISLTPCSSSSAPAMVAVVFCLIGVRLLPGRQNHRTVEAVGVTPHGLFICLCWGCDEMSSSKRPWRLVVLRLFCLNSGGRKMDTAIALSVQSAYKTFGGSGSRSFM